MEAAHSARQARLASLRQAKEELASGSTTSSSNSAKPIHPFRRAFLLTPSLRKQGDPSTASTTTDAAQDLAASTVEGQLLRRFRNWDPMTGQPRDGLWNTIQGIEDEVKDVQAEALRQDEENRLKELDLKNLAPRKQNWDLRNHWEKRLKKLSRKDKEARLVLIRQRLKSANASSSATAKQNAQAMQAEIAMSTATTRGTRGLVNIDGQSDASDSSDEE